MGGSKKDDKKRKDEEEDDDDDDEDDAYDEEEEEDDDKTFYAPEKLNVETLLRTTSSQNFAKEVAQAKDNQEQQQGVVTSPSPSKSAEVSSPTPLAPLAPSSASSGTVSPRSTAIISPRPNPSKFLVVQLTHSFGGLTDVVTLLGEVPGLEQIANSLNERLKEIPRPAGTPVGNYERVSRDEWTWQVPARGHGLTERGLLHLFDKMESLGWKLVTQRPSPNLAFTFRIAASA